MSGIDPAQPDAAIDWAVRIQDVDFDDWEEHLAWLDAHPSHPELYRRAAAAIADGVEALGPAGAPRANMAANDDEALVPRSSWRRRGGWAAVTTALAASLVIMLLPDRAPEHRETVFGTALGETRIVTLHDGTVLNLNGGTLVRVPASDPRRVMLDSGEVFVAVAHDSDHPFRLTVGDAVFQDVGTAFNVRADQAETAITVAEGVVAYDPERSDVQLSAGKSLTITGQRVELGQVEPETIGSWRSRRLVYANAELGHVATDLSRALGLRVEASKAVAGYRFSGIVVLDASPAVIVGRVSSLAQVSSFKRPQGWVLDAQVSSRPGKRK